MLNCTPVHVFSFKKNVKLLVVSPMHIFSQSCFVLKLLVLPSHPPNKNSVQMPESALKYHRESNDSQGPISFGRKHGSEKGPLRSWTSDFWISSSLS